MRYWIAALSVATMVMTGIAPAHCAPAHGAAQFVERAEWVHWGDLTSLRVYPTAAGRAEAGQLGTLPEGEIAWTQVLELAPDADIEGMREQFLCHWQLAEFGEPGKTSWNLEPWRPVVDAATMIEAGCNPGGTLEPF